MEPYLLSHGPGAERSLRTLPLIADAIEKSEEGIGMRRRFWLLLLSVPLIACGEAGGNIQATQTRTSELGVFATQTRVIELAQLATVTALVPTATHVQPSGAMRRTPETVSTCPEDKPIKGYTSESGEKLYEIPEHLHYREVPAEECFYNTSGATVAGYRQPSTPTTPTATAISVISTPNLPPTPQPTALMPTPIPTATQVARVPQATATASTAEAAVRACGGGTISIRLNPQLAKDLAQWNHIVDAANKVTAAWNKYADDTSTITTFDDAVGNSIFVTSIDAVLVVAQEQLPIFQAEAAGGRFAVLAEKHRADTSIMIRYLSLLREAAVTGDVDTWNSAIDVQDELDAADAALDADVQAQCTFWRSQR